MRMKTIKHYIISYPLAIFGSLLVVLFSFCIIFNIVKINLVTLVNELTKAMFSFELLSIFSSFPPYFLKILTITLIFSGFMIFSRRHYSHKIYHEDNNYYNSDPFFFFYIARIFGFQKINPVNIPIWIQAKIILRTNLKFIEQILDNNNEEGKVVKYNIVPNSNIKEFNFIIEDTYKIRNDDLSQKKLQFPTVKVQRGHFSSGYHLYNEWLIEQCSKEIDNIITRGGNRINFFCSTNPKHTFLIFNNLLPRLERESNITIYVYQSEHKDGHFVYDEPHKIY